MYNFYGVKKMITYKEASQNQIKELCEIRKQQLIDEGIEPSIDIDQDLERFLKIAFRIIISMKSWLMIMIRLLRQRQSASMTIHQHIQIKQEE